LNDGSCGLSCPDEEKENEGYFMRDFGKCGALNKRRDLIKWRCISGEVVNRGQNLITAKDRNLEERF